VHLGGDRPAFVLVGPHEVPAGEQHRLGPRGLQPPLHVAHGRVTGLDAHERPLRGLPEHRRQRVPRLLHLAPQRRQRHERPPRRRREQRPGHVPPGQLLRRPPGPLAHELQIRLHAQRAYAAPSHPEKHGPPGNVRVTHGREARSAIAESAGIAPQAIGKFTLFPQVWAALCIIAVADAYRKAGDPDRAMSLCERNPTDAERSPGDVARLTETVRNRLGTDKSGAQDD